MQLEHSRAFVDVASINGSLDGFEIKSDVDDLTRLSRQIEWYGMVCDRATLVASERHLSVARDTVPRWWGLIVARPAKSGVVLEAIRPAKQNGRRSVTSVLNLLRKTELIRMLAAQGESQPIWQLDKARAIGAVREMLGVEVAHAVALRVLRFRKTWTARQLGVLTECERLAHAGRQEDPFICLATNDRW
jgi:hypothetical protein